MKSLLLSNSMLFVMFGFKGMGVNSSRGITLFLFLPLYLLYQNFFSHFYSWFWCYYILGYADCLLCRVAYVLNSFSFPFIFFQMIAVISPFSFLFVMAKDCLSYCFILLLLFRLFASCLWNQISVFWISITLS